MFTIALFGDSGVGKSTLWRTVVGRSTEFVQTTVGYDVAEAALLSHAVRWVDTSGEERWQPFLPWVDPSSLDLVLLCFDTNRMSSWLNLEGWLDVVNDGTPRIVVGIKSGSARSVSYRRASTAAMVNGIPYVEWDGTADGVHALVDLLLHYIASHSTHSTNLARVYHSIAPTPSPPKKGTCDSKTFFC